MPDAASNIGGIWFDLRAPTGAFEQDMNRAKAAATRTTSSIDGALRSVGGLLRGGGLLLGIRMMGDAFDAATKAVIDYKTGAVSALEAVESMIVRVPVLGQAYATGMSLRKLIEWKDELAKAMIAQDAIERAKAAAVDESLKQLSVQTNILYLDERDRAVAGQLNVLLKQRLEVMGKIKELGRHGEGMIPRIVETFTQAEEAVKYNDAMKKYNDAEEKAHKARMKYIKEELDEKLRSAASDKAIAEEQQRAADERERERAAAFEAANTWLRERQSLEGRARAAELRMGGDEVGARRAEIEAEYGGAGGLIRQAQRQGLTAEAELYRRIAYAEWEMAGQGAAAGGAAAKFMQREAGRFSAGVGGAGDPLLNVNTEQLKVQREMLKQLQNPRPARAA